MTDQAVISPVALQAAITELNQQGAENLLGRIQQAEPEFGSFIHHMAVQVAGKLALSGAPAEVIQGVHNDLLGACALTYLAFRKGSYEIWQDTVLDQRLKDLEVEPAAPAAASPEAGTAPPRAAVTLPEHELAVVLVNAKGGRKRDLIRTLCHLTGHDCRQARALLARLPVVVMQGISPEQATSIMNALQQVGAHAIVRAVPLNDKNSPGE
jgi:ribosomal protein L7/L12